ncbi:hypothetical protein ARTHROSP310_27110 [Arthrobacter sp. AD-310]
MTAATHPLEGLSLGKQTSLAKPRDAAEESTLKSCAAGPWERFQGPMGEQPGQSQPRP